MKSTRKNICAALVAMAVLCSAGVANAQWVLLDSKAHAIVEEGLDATYNLRYTEADVIFDKLIKEYPEHPAGYFLSALVDWWRIVPNISVDSKVERFSESFNNRIDKTIEICNDRLDKNEADIVGLFFKGAALGYRARLKVSANFSVTSILEWRSAFSDAQDAREMLLQCQRLAPGNSDILFGAGLYNYLVEAIPEKYPIAKMAAGMFPPGDKEIGLQMLRISAQKAVYAGTEAQYSLLELLDKFERNYTEAVQVAEALHQKYPGNPVFYKYLAKCYYMSANFTKADTAWSDILQKIKRRESGYELTLARQGLYYLGDIRLRTGKYEDAVRILQEADKVSRRLGDDEESSWVVLTNLKLGYAYDKLKKRKEAIKQYQRVLDMDDYSEAHTNARKYIAQPYQ